jgi:hypothetical protein
VILYAYLRRDSSELQSQRGRKVIYVYINHVCLSLSGEKMENEEDHRDVIIMSCQSCWREDELCHF